MDTTVVGIAGLDRIAQVKLPVTDLARSVSWYRRLFDLRLWTEFVEDGVLRGAGLIDPQGRFNIALRCDRLDIAHSGIYETGAGPRLDVPDPDGTVVRFYYYTGPTDGFTGLEMRDGQVVGTYQTPQLQ